MATITIPPATPDPNAVWPIDLPPSLDAKIREYALWVPTRGYCAFGAERPKGRRLAGVIIPRPVRCGLLAPNGARVLDVVRWTRDQRAILLHVLSCGGYYLIIGGLREHALAPELGDVGFGRLLAEASALVPGSLFIQYVSGEGGLSPADFMADFRRGAYRWMPDEPPSKQLRDITPWLQEIRERTK